MGKWLHVLNALAGLAVVSAAVQDQTPFRASTNLVEVYVTVRTHSGPIAQGFKQKDFELLIDGKRQNIALFSTETQPITAMLLLDRSGSIGQALPNVSAGAAAFVNEMLPGDRVAISTLSRDCLPFTSNQTDLLNALRWDLEDDTGSPVWSGLYRAMSSLFGQPGRRVIIMLSDGIDTGIPEWVRANRPPPLLPGPCPEIATYTDTSVRELTGRATRENLMVYTFGVQVMFGFSNGGDLRRMAAGSGGEFTWLTSGDNLPTAFKRIADELHHQYLLGFVPKSMDGRAHAIEVRCLRPDVTVRARRSYIAG